MRVCVCVYTTLAAFVHDTVAVFSCAWQYRVTADAYLGTSPGEESLIITCDSATPLSGNLPFWPQPM